MKAKIHPQYYQNAKVVCACGNTFTTGSTLPEISVDICSACHPFFTGEMKLVDTQGRIEKFEAKRAKARQVSKKKSVKSTKTKARYQSLKEMLKPETKKAAPASKSKS